MVWNLLHVTVLVVVRNILNRNLVHADLTLSVADAGQSEQTLTQFLYSWTDEVVETKYNTTLRNYINPSHEKLFWNIRKNKLFSVILYLSVVIFDDSSCSEHSISNTSQDDEDEDTQDHPAPPGVAPAPILVIRSQQDQIKTIRVLVSDQMVWRWLWLHDLHLKLSFYLPTSDIFYLKYYFVQ